MNHESDHTVDAAKKELNADLLELFERCSYLYNEAFYANTELAILRELSKASSGYENEVICAGCFFSFTQLALYIVVVLGQSIFFNPSNFGE